MTQAVNCHYIPYTAHENYEATFVSDQYENGAELQRYQNQNGSRIWRFQLQLASPIADETEPRLFVVQVSINDVIFVRVTETKEGQQLPEHSIPMLSGLRFASYSFANSTVSGRGVAFPLASPANHQII